MTTAPTEGTEMPLETRRQRVDRWLWTRHGPEERHTWGAVLLVGLPFIAAVLLTVFTDL